VTKRETELAEALTQLIRACNMRDAAVVAESSDEFFDDVVDRYISAIDNARKILEETKP
jgi:hypothetical protein